MHEAPGAVGGSRGQRWDGKVVKVPPSVLCYHSGLPGRVGEWRGGLAGFMRPRTQWATLEGGAGAEKSSKCL